MQKTKIAFGLKKKPIALARGVGLVEDDDDDNNEQPDSKRQKQSSAG